MKKTSRTIIFFGNEKLATGIPQPEPVIKEALERSGFVIERVVTGAINTLGEHVSELAVLAAYGQIIPPAVLDEFPLGIINIHPSLLPQYRGSTPVEQAILDGASKTGVSIMRLTNAMDEGPIYKQKSLSLTGSESKAEITESLARLGAELLVEVLPGIADGSLEPRSQSHPDRATYCSRISKADGLVDWNKPAKVLEREVRAYASWPKSTAKLGPVEVVITEAQVVSEDLAPSQIRATKNELIVGTRERALKILRLKPVGKSEMSVSAFLAGYRSRIS